MPRLDRLRALLAHPRVPLVATALAALLLVPSIFAGLAADDYVHWLRANGTLAYGSRLDVFDFCDGDPKNLDALRDAGVLPWFAYDGIRLAFFRPLSSLTHFIDYKAWPGAPWLMHLESVAIYAALVYFVAVLYRRVLPSAKVAGLAALLYAVDPGHGVTGWIAGRNGVLAAALGAAAIVAHDRWRRSAWKPGAFVGPLLYVLALLAGEAGLAALAYLVAHAVFLEEGPVRKRVGAAAPYLAVTVAWQILYRATGSGAHGSNIYLDPATEPGRFLLEAPGRAIALLVGELTLFPSDVYLYLSRAGVLALVVSGLVFLAIFGWALLPAVRSRRGARFFAAGAVLSVVPALATFPSNRLLFFVGIGAVGLVAEVIARHSSSSARSLPVAVLAVFLVAVHVVVAPFLLVANSEVLHAAVIATDALSLGLPSPGEFFGRTVVIVNTPNVIASFYRFVIPRDGTVRAGRGRLLSCTAGVVHVTRTSEDSVTMRAEGDLLDEPFAGLFRGDAYPMTPGQTFRAGGMTVRVDAVAPNGHPTLATFAMPIPLDDPSLYWIAWDRGRFVRFIPPPVGAEMRLGPE